LATAVSIFIDDDWAQAMFGQRNGGTHSGRAGPGRLLPTANSLLVTPTAVASLCFDTHPVGDQRQASLLIGPVIDPHQAVETDTHPT
jgi:hypothetical protein